MSDTPSSPEETAGRRVRSIAHNLAVLYIVSIVIGFTMCALLLYFKLVQHIHDSGGEQLQAEITSVRALVGSPAGLNALKQMMDAEERGEDAGTNCILMRIVDRNGKVVVDCPTMRAVLPGSIFPSPGDTRAKRYSHNGGNYLLRSVKLTDPISEAGGWRLQIGIDLTEHDQLIRVYRTYLVLFGFGAFLFAIPSSYVVVRRGLKPLDEISGSIKTITGSRLNTRLDAAGFPVEMHPVIESVNGMMARLEDSFQRLSHYSGNLAHELRTPINNLMLSAEIALAHERSPQEYQEIISSSLTEYERLAAVIDKLLFLARADNEKNDLLFEKLDARTEVEEVIDYFLEEARAAGVSLVHRVDATFWGDRTLFRRALSNLISNALTYTPAGGEVTISASSGGNGEVDIAVADTGCGIYSEHLPFLFDRFYRVKSGSHHSGTGLGLAIVKAIMEMHNGDVSAWSRPGHGTTITLHFPQHPSLKSAPAAEG
ncbi:heavy metal sensor histidine kinase [Geomonas subterranea]|uniref:histidine kinase n=1 Tax=Geomonas subterranea TaxID=2847989 RepID=A0ABX8LI34_9BACT|nr:heavy metal sensor histidine kinase [Geomonas subterranea]QXE90571.1 heavy metal sensor histidine kinase [Geomonas subterranea]QXM11350.1 heavy metal sensor histidine kinase [Geomonas subterranea]